MFKTRQTQSVGSDSSVKNIAPSFALYWESNVNRSFWEINIGFVFLEIKFVRKEYIKIQADLEQKSQEIRIWKNTQNILEICR